MTPEMALALVVVTETVLMIGVLANVHALFARMRALERRLEELAKMPGMVMPRSGHQLHGPIA